MNKSWEHGAAILLIPFVRLPPSLPLDPKYDYGYATGTVVSITRHIDGLIIRRV